MALGHIISSAVFGWFACIQLFAGIPGGRVDCQDWAPGGHGVQRGDGLRTQREFYTLIVLVLK